MRLKLPRPRLSLRTLAVLIAVLAVTLWAGPDEELDRLAVDAGLDGDRLAGLALQAAEDECGGGPLLGAVGPRQVAFQE
jgi:hypothetical protein